MSSTRSKPAQRQAVNNPKRRGDHYVTLVVQVPKKMNRAQKEALKKYAEAMGETL